MLSFLNFKKNVVFLFFFIIASHPVQADGFFTDLMGSKTNNAIQTWHKTTEIEKLLELGAPDTAATIMEENEWKELLCDQMLAQINRTQTGFGLWGLRNGLRPIANKTEIEVVQKRLQTIIGKDELYKNLHDSLAVIKENEDAFLTYYNDVNALHNDAKKSYYSLLFPSYLNKNKLALDLSFGADLAKYGSIVAAYLGVAGILSKLHAPNPSAMRKIQNFQNELTPLAIADGSMAYKDIWEKLFKQPVQEESLWSSFKKGLVAPFVGHIPWSVRFADANERDTMRRYPVHYANSIENSLGDTIALYTEGFNYNKAFVSACALGSVLAGDMHAAFMLKVGFDQLKVAWEIPDKLKIELVKIAHFFNALESICSVAELCPEFQSYPPIRHLKSLFDQQSGAVHELINHMRTLEADSTSPFYSRGRILLLHKLLQETKDELIPFMNDIAQIDALVSMVELYKEGSAARPWSFVNFVDGKKPIINAEDFWLPLVHTEDVVLNSIALGSAVPSKVVLTGPNGGGKSTIMKAIAYQIIFAQSWGIVPAGAVDMTVFTGMRTALNPQEDIKRGLSTFMAQKLRMDEITSFIKSAAAEDIFFVAVDEPYRGTVEAESQKRVCGFSYEVALYDQVMMMMATHFEKPTQLATSLPAYYANYQCEFIKTDDGRLQRTYKLLPGAALWWFHDDAMRSMYIDCLEYTGLAA